MKNIYVVCLALICFHLNAQIPAITSLSPATGAVGSQVVISGNNFSSTATANIVYFGPVKATVTAASSTSLTVTVPLAAGFQPVSVTVNNNISFSNTGFTVSYAGGGKNFDAASFATGIGLSGGAIASVGDLDGDGKVDAVSTLFTSNVVTVSRNTTTGGVFSFAATNIGGLINPIAVKLADLNGDGLLDMVVANSTFNLLYVLKNTSLPGTISFAAAIPLATGAEPRKLAIGDIDKDGKTDIICSNQTDNSISVLRNTSAAGNIAFATHVDFATLATPEGVCTGDMDNDGKTDIMAVCSDGFAVGLFRNTSVPGTISFEARRDYPTGTFPWDVAAADLNGDGKLEMIISNSGPNSISVYTNTSTAAVSFAAKKDFATNTSPRGLVVADLDADGKPDIATAAYSSVSVADVLKNTSVAGVVSFNSHVPYSVNGGALGIVAADFDGDGLTDLLSSNSLSNNTNLTYLRNILPINTAIAKCPLLMAPANNAVLQYDSAQLFKWRKDPNATGYKIKITPQTGAFTEITLTDTSYTFTPQAGTSYTWTVTPLNLPDPNAVCNSFAFSTCAATATAVTIIGPASTSKCASDSIKLRASTSTNIRWFLDGKLVTGATGDSLWAKQAGAYTVREINGSCYSQPSNSVTVNNLAVPAKPVLVLGGPLVFCAGGSLKLSASLSALGYQWFNNSAAVPGATNDNYTATNTGKYYIQITDSNGCHNNSDTASILVNALPSTPVVSVVSGSANLCAGDSLLLGSSAPTGNQWYKDNTLIAGATQQQIKTKLAGSYTVVVTQNTCNSLFSAATIVAVNPLPSTPSVTIVAGAGSFCSGDSVTLSSSASIGNQWFKNNIAIPGATLQQLKTSTAGNYSVVTTQSTCASAASASQLVTVYPLPPKPVITAAGITLSTASGWQGYKWFFNGTPINGATRNEYAITQTGLHKVEITDMNGCKIMSDEINYVYTGLNDVKLEGNKIEFYPNPVTENLTVKVTRTNTDTKTISLLVTDINGRVYKIVQLQNGINSISFSGYTAGTYNMVLQIGNNKKTVKIFKVQQ